MKRSTFLKKKSKILRRDHRHVQDTYRVYFTKTNKHFYASLICNNTSNVIVSVASHAVASSDKNSSERVSALAKSFSQKVSGKEYNGLFFDRGVYQYHGLVKQFVDEIRENGVKV